MDRRKFLSGLIDGVATTAALRTFPFRIYSFPKEIIPSRNRILGYISSEDLRLFGGTGDIAVRRFRYEYDAKHNRILIFTEPENVNVTVRFAR